MRIQSLLNPVSGSHYIDRDSRSPTPPPVHTYSVVQDVIAPKRQKIAKDAMILTAGLKVNGIVNYPPYEVGDDQELAAHHRRFRIHPSGNIADFRRHIPYTSDKKEFTEKTGRQAFEVFQFSYKIPDQEREWVVIWDYNVGLVKITPFFKSLNYTKTTPAKVLDKNAGLRDICHSITGGALTAQGYWMPFQAAKAVAATFCWEIRFALTPIFGPSFPSLCLTPDHPKFAKFEIDAPIIHECTVECARWRDEKEGYRATPETEEPATPRTPPTSFPSSDWSLQGPKDRRKKKPADVESGYGTDTDQSDKYHFSPNLSPRSNMWTAVNRSRSPITLPTTSHHISLRPGSYKIDMWPVALPSINSLTSQLRTKRTCSRTAFMDSDVESSPRVPGYGTDSDGDYIDEGEEVAQEEEYDADALEAAQSLLNLSSGVSYVQVAPHPAKRTRRGSQF
ncbi:hypothetical protein EJ04DRAFT_540537 [Polyplosphaeria fusca]|uniref:HTH APSES-type domain-containing protein n=1 Tax=Polyplosphaeria fusca TaxID=682080 RepID=A0A9P4V7K2_9PLEO|nr:hypothetical protein EJ04DRAFT_540537 [Polyplosphaeria fusca]